MVRGTACLSMWVAAGLCPAACIASVSVNSPPAGPCLLSQEGAPVCSWVITAASRAVPAKVGATALMAGETVLLTADVLFVLLAALLAASSMCQWSMSASGAG